MELSQFLRVRPGRVKLLLVLTATLLYVVFRPIVDWAVFAVLPTRVVTSRDVEASVARRWMARVKDSAIEEWIPCTTIFCSSPPSSMSIQKHDNWSGIDAENWIPRVKSEERAKGFVNTVRRSINSDAGVFECLESRKQINADFSECICFASGLGLTAGFDGRVSDVKDFHFIVSTVKTRNN